MPPPGGYVEILSEEFLLGGEAANTANALRAWGVDFILAGNALGTDTSAVMLQEALREHGLEAFDGHLLPAEHAPVCDVYVADDGERTMIGQGFSAMKETVDPAKLPFQPGEWFTAEPNMGETAAKAVELAYAAGMRTYTMDFVREEAPIYPGSFWQSSTDWAGTRGDAAANLQWLTELVTRTGCFGILTDGGQGFFAGSAETGVRHYAPFPLDRFVDATGAGDMFRAGMLLGLDRSWPISRTLQFASVAGCLACRSLGATTSVPTTEEVDAYIARHSKIAQEYE